MVNASNRSGQKKIIYDLNAKWEEDSPARYGFTGRAKLIECARRPKLDKEVAKQRETSSKKNQQEYFGIGKIYHAYQDLYHTGKLSSVRDVIFTPAPREDDIYEAQRLMEDYCVEHSADFWGINVIGAEVELPGSPESRARLYSKWGLKGGSPIEEWSGWIDLAVYLTNDDADRISCYLSGGPQLPGAGIYLIDTKTDYAELAIHQQKYSDGIQFMQYQSAWNNEFPDRPCSGVIISSTIKTTRVKFAKYYQPAITEREEHINRSFLNLARRRYNEENSFNPLSCFSSFRPCQHAISGLCNRGSIEKE